MTDKEFVIESFRSLSFPSCDPVSVRSNGKKVKKYVITRSLITGMRCRISGACLSEDAAWASAAKRIREKGAANG